MFAPVVAPSSVSARSIAAAAPGGGVGRASSSLDELASVAPADWRVFQALCEISLAQDDPYLEVETLGDLCAERDWNERNFLTRLDHFARLGWVRLGGRRAGVGVGLPLVEITFLGLDRYCRAAGRVDYPALVREVASCLVYETGVDTGARLRCALLRAGARIARAVPDLLLAHAVEALAKVGLLETCQQWGGALGFQIGRVAPELRRWVEHGSAPVLAAAA